MDGSCNKAANTVKKFTRKQHHEAVITAGTSLSAKAGKEGRSGEEDF
jgi:hypothetical protein